MSLAKNIASSTLAQIFSRFFVAGLSIISVKLITNYLGTKGYGEYTVVYEMMAFALIMADFGFFHIALKEMGKNRQEMSKILSNILSLRLLISLATVVLTSGIVFFATDYNLSTVKIGVMIASANVVFGLMGTTITAILQVHLKMGYAAMVQIIGKICMILYIAFATFNDLGFLHTLYAGLFGSLIILFLTFYYTRKYAKVYLGFDFSLWKELFKQALPMGIGLIFYNVYLRSPVIILDRITLDSHLTGIYGVALRILEIFIFIPIAFLNSTLPTLSELIHKDKNENFSSKINQLIQVSFDLLNAIAFPVVFGIMITAPTIIQLVSGSAFLESADILRLLVIMLIFYFPCTLFSYILLAANHQKSFAIANFFAGITSVALSLILVPYIQVYGTLAGHIIPEIIALIITYYYAKKAYPFVLNYKPTIRIIFAALTMAAVIYPFSDLNIFIKVVLAGIIYLASLVIYKALPFETIYTSTFKKILDIPALSENSKKIAIDVRSIYGQKTGKEWYTFSLLNSLAKIDSKNHYILYSKYDFDITNFPANFSKRILNSPLWIWHLHVLIDMVINKVDIFFATSSYIIASLARFNCKIKVILVVHDLVAFLFPASKHAIKAVIIERLTGRLAFSKAAQIIVPSHNTYNDLSRKFPSTKNKITIIPEAARESFNANIDKSKITAILEKYHLPEKYLIFIGTLEPRKNLVRLFEAFSLLDESKRNEYPLVIVGKKGWYYNEIFQTVKTKKLTESVIFTGYVPDEDLPYILSNSYLCVYPSKYEGFGLPLLEAMQCGTPIVSSNTPALLEVAEGVAEIADRKDVKSIKTALINVLTNEQRRKELIEKGFNKIKEYSWDKTAKEVLKLIEK